MFEKSRYYKIFIIILFPFLRAFFIANTLLYIPIMLVVGMGLPETLIPFWINNPSRGMLMELVNALFVWGLFYLSIIIIFKRDEWLDRFYQFSKPLVLTAPLGVIFYVVGIFYPNGMDMFLMSIAFWFFLVVLFTPLILCETIWFGVLMKRTKGYGRFKSQCYSFAMFLLLPLVVPFLAHWLFVTILVTRH